MNIGSLCMYEWPSAIVKSIKHGKKVPFDKYFYKYLKYEDGKIKLIHEQIRECVMERYLTNEEIIKNYRNKIIDTLSVNISKFKESSKDEGRIEEYAYHLLKLGDKHTLEFIFEEPIVKEYFNKYHKEFYNYILQELFN